jgi:hypothetical protein
MFVVERLDSALDELAAAWAIADSELRNAITKACNEVDRRLVRTPRNEGESRPGGRRITFVPPLAATFQIEGNGTTVTVLHVRVFRSRKK